MAIIEQEQNLSHVDVCKIIITNRLYQGNLSPIALNQTIKTFNNAFGQLNKIGININQSVRTLNGAAEQQSGIEIRTIIKSFEPKLKELLAILIEVEDRLNDVAGADYNFWQGD